MGSWGRPQWPALQEGMRPPPVTDVEPGEWAHGWPKSWSDAPPSLSSGLHQISSERLSWRDSVCRCLFVKSGASVDCWSTVTDGTEQFAPTQARLRTRASAPERTLARVCREAGASVRSNAKLVDMNIAVPADDAREVEVLASAQSLFHGAQLSVDITLRSALTATAQALQWWTASCAWRPGLIRSGSTLNSSMATDAG